MHRTFIFITSESSVTPLNVVSGLEWSESEQVLFERLGSCPIGLTESSAVEKYRRAPRSIGIVHATGLRLVMRQFVSPVTLILLGVSVVSAVLGEMSQSLIVLTIVGISALLGFLQERGAVRAVQTLLGTVSVHADVLRGGREREVGLAEVVPGDVVVLRSGDVVPGDGRVLRANQLRVDESALTGEAFPRSKTPGILGSRVSLAERTNMVHLGSYVASGEGHVLVTRTGTDTEFGRISGAVASQHLPTAFERGVTAFGLMLMRTTLVLVTAICLVNLAFGRPVGDSILFSLALAVGLMPQMLPAIVTVGLSRGAQAMAKSKVIVKRLDAIEDVGGSGHPVHRQDGHDHPGLRRGTGRPRPVRVSRSTGTAVGVADGALPAWVPEPARRCNPRRRCVVVRVVDVQWRGTVRFRPQENVGVVGIRERVAPRDEGGVRVVVRTLLIRREQGFGTTGRGGACRGDANVRTIVGLRPPVARCGLQVLRRRRYRCGDGTHPDPG